MLAPPALRKVHPLGKSPVIQDGNVTLAESGAIVEYLVDTYAKGRLAPAREAPEYVRFLYWLHYAEGSAMPPLLMKLVFDRIDAAPMPFFFKPVLHAIVARVRGSFIQPQIELHLDYLESELGSRQWFVGDDFTAADIQLSFPLEAAAARGGLNGGRPGLQSFLARIHARQAYRRALERGGKYDLLR
jgi:glutathione S-transferase